jgi:hypothetical protein
LQKFALGNLSGYFLARQSAQRRRRRREFVVLRVRAATMEGRFAEGRMFAEGVLSSDPDDVDARRVRGRRGGGGLISSGSCCAIFRARALRRRQRGISAGPCTGAVRRGGGGFCCDESLILWSGATPLRCASLGGSSATSRTCARRSRRRQRTRRLCGGSRVALWSSLGTQVKQMRGGGS